MGLSLLDKMNPRTDENSTDRKYNRIMYQFSTHPFPICCTYRVVTMNRLSAMLLGVSVNRVDDHTLGKFTLGTITLFRALGASFGALDLSPPGWYWYLKCSSGLLPLELSTCQGMVPSAMLTLTSDDADVGLRPREYILTPLQKRLRE